jgi:hypothetical protein
MGQEGSFSAAVAMLDAPGVTVSQTDSKCFTLPKV